MKKKTKKSFSVFPALLVFIAVVSFLASVYLWYNALTPPEDRITISMPSRVSPDAFSAGLEGNLRMALESFGVESEDITAEEPADTGAGIRTVYKIRVPRNVPFTRLHLELSEMADEMGGEVLSGVEGDEGRVLTLTLGTRGTPTDVIVLSRSRAVVEKRVKIAVVIDDLGIKDLSYARRLIDLDQTVTLAILPFQPHTDDILDMVHDNDIPYILHMPMEPKSDSVNPGEGAIYTTDDQDTVQRKLKRAFDSVEDAPGMNNHMGSKVTEDARIMEYVTKWLSRRNLSFLDSKTSLGSRGYELSQRNGVKSGRISGYLDAVNDPERIEERLTALTDMAFDRGSAIILGHDRPETIQILERRLPEIAARGAVFVPLSELLK